VCNRETRKPLTPVKNLALLPVAPFLFIEYNPFICAETDDSSGSVIIRAEIMNVNAKEFGCKDVYAPPHSDVVFALFWEALRFFDHLKITRAGWHSGNALQQRWQTVARRTGPVRARCSSGQRSL
jgi:hypothetical protein